VKSITTLWMSAIALLVFLGGIRLIFGDHFADHQLISGDLGDSQFINIILEHLWQAVIGTVIWDSPIFFYPASRMLFGSETFISAGPIYWLFRFLGNNEYMSYQYWVYSCFVLNFISFFILLRLWIRNPLLVIAGAFLFAFSLPRLAQVGHSQLLIQYFMIFAVYFFARYLKEKRTIWFGLFVLFCVLQVYGSWYYAWFLFLLILIWGLVVFAKKSLRREAVVFIKGDIGTLFIYMGLGILMLLPILIGYFGLHFGSGSASYAEARDYLPNINSWFALRPEHWWNLIIPAKFQPDAGFLGHEKYLGMGLFFLPTVLLALFGFYKVGLPSESRLMRILVISAAVLFVISLKVGDQSLWVHVHSLVPAAKSIRATARIGLVIIPILIVLICLYGDRVQNKKLKILLYVLICIVCFEQLSPSRMHFKLDSVEQVVERIRPQLDSNCKQFFVFDVLNRPPMERLFLTLAAMRVAIQTGIPTVNGYTGYYPKNYPSELSWNYSPPPKEREQIGRLIDTWFAREDKLKGQTCLIAI
jgi:hypothetical protein